MIVTLHSKFVRFFVIEGQLRWRLLTIVVLCIAVGFQRHTALSKTQEMVEVRKEWSLVSRIPGMERELEKRRAIIKQIRQEQEALRRAAAEFIEPEDILVDAEEEEVRPILEGVTLHGGSLVALIDGEIYEEGAIVGDYVIQKILMTEVIMFNTVTQEEEWLYFIEE